VTYEWMEGGFFLIQRVDLGQQDGQRITGIEVIGRERPFGAEPCGAGRRGDVHGRRGDLRGDRRLSSLVAHGKPRPAAEPRIGVPSVACAA
jgi:hypothetical protein